MKFDLNLLDKYVSETTMCSEKHPDADLYIYGYYSDHISNTPSIWDDVSIHCRGLILNGKGEVVERPFPKFWTYRQYLSKGTVLLSEDKILKIPEGRFRIMEKVDGTMCTLYWVNDIPYLATQRSFTNIKCVEATKILHQKYSHLFSVLDKSLTYVFEAIYPETKVLIDYGNTRDLYLIGIIDKVSGELLPLPDIGFPLCKDYTEEYGHITNFDELCALDLKNKEGFVIYFGGNQIMKLKFPWYQEAHRVLDFFFHKEKVSYAKTKELHKIFGGILPEITNIDVLACLRDGDYNLLSIRNKVHSFYYLMGLEYWLQRHKRIYMNLYKSNGENWNICDPLTLDKFDIEKRLSTPHIHETIVWEWGKRYLRFDKD